MKRLTFILLPLFLTLSPGQAVSAERNRAQQTPIEWLFTPYVSAKLGWSYMSGSTQVGWDDQQADYSANVMVSNYTIGMAVTPLIRTEFEYSYRTNGEDTINDYAVLGGFWAPYTKKYSLSSHSFLINAYVDVPLDETYQLRPYIGIGAGIMYFDGHIDFTTGGVTSRDNVSSSSTAFQMMGGFLYNVMPHVAVDCGLRIVGSTYDQGVSYFETGIGLMFKF